MQVQNPHSIKYNGTIQGLKYIWRTEGLRGLFKGNGTNCARIVPNSAVKFFSYEQASRFVIVSNYCHPTLLLALLPPTCYLSFALCRPFLCCMMSLLWPDLGQKHFLFTLLLIWFSFMKALVIVFLPSLLFYAVEFYGFIGNKQGMVCFSPLLPYYTLVFLCMHLSYFESVYTPCCYCRPLVVDYVMSLMTALRFFPFIYRKNTIVDFLYSACPSLVQFSVSIYIMIVFKIVRPGIISQKPSFV